MAKESMTPLGWLRKRLEDDGSDLVREMLGMFGRVLMSPDVDARCGASSGERSPARINQRNGYRDRAWDTRAGTIALQIPKVRQGTYYPDRYLVSHSIDSGVPLLAKVDVRQGRCRPVPGDFGRRRDI